VSLVAIGYQRGDGTPVVVGWARAASTAAQIADALRRQVDNPFFSGLDSWTIPTNYAEPTNWASNWTEIIGYFRGQWYYFGKYDWWYLDMVIAHLNAYFGGQVYLGIESNPAMERSWGTSRLPVLAHWRMV